jgi:hypothetical protein
VNVKALRHGAAFVAGRWRCRAGKAPRTCGEWTVRSARHSACSPMAGKHF